MCVCIYLYTYIQEFQSFFWGGQSDEKRRPLVPAVTDRMDERSSINSRKNNKPKDGAIEMLNGIQTNRFQRSKKRGRKE